MAAAAGFFLLLLCASSATTLIKFGFPAPLFSSVLPQGLKERLSVLSPDVGGLRPGSEASAASRGQDSGVPDSSWEHRKDGTGWFFFFGFFFIRGV